jgi:hypothetical protein
MSPPSLTTLQPDRKPTRRERRAFAAITAKFELNLIKSGMELSDVAEVVADLKNLHEAGDNEALREIFRRLKW